MMTRNDLELLARAIRAVVEQHAGNIERKHSALYGVGLAITAICEAAQNINARFDETKFRVACGVAIPDSENPAALRVQRQLIQT